MNRIEGQRIMARTNPAEELRTPLELAERLKIQPRTLQEWRSIGKGPSFLRVGRVIRYRESDIEKWLNQQVEQVE
jgi:predicted site-specific integrase-resolvase